LVGFSSWRLSVTLVRSCGTTRMPIMGLFGNHLPAPLPSIVFPTVFLLLSQQLLSPVAALQKEMTISVGPGKVDCFYEVAKAGQTIDIEYQVIDGGHGDLDISFELAEFLCKVFDQQESRCIAKVFPQILPCMFA
uniref:GOLD domain-containing protein n=1 Tax=Anopheles atroparvus TaxID=41427 RepID=A0A182JAD0_ANOAO